jgi:hypothetical protein
VNMLNKQSGSDDNGWFFSLVVGRGAKNSSVKKRNTQSCVLA